MGHPLSPMFAVLVLQDAMEALLSYKSEEGIVPIIYADDGCLGEMELSSTRRCWRQWPMYSNRMESS